MESLILLLAFLSVSLMIYALFGMMGSNKSRLMKRLQAATSARFPGKNGPGEGSALWSKTASLGDADAAGTAGAAARSGESGGASALAGKGKNSAIARLVRSFSRLLFGDDEAESYGGGFSEESAKGWRGWFSNLARKKTSSYQTKKKDNWLHRLEDKLQQANLPIKVEEYMAVQLGLTFVPALLSFILTFNLVLALVLALTGYMIPPMFVARAKSQRVKNLNGQLGDALVIMANSLKAGFSFFQAMELVSREMPSPICEEFGRVLREINLGSSSEEALLGLTRRVDSDDLDLVVTAVLIQRQVGGNLAEVLNTISHTIRERVRIKGEIKTLTAQGRISGMVVGLLPVAVTVILLIINPSYMSVLFTKTAGLIALGIGVFSQVVGMMVIRKITDIKI